MTENDRETLCPALVSVCSNTGTGGTWTTHTDTMHTNWRYLVAKKVFHFSIVRAIAKAFHFSIVRAISIRNITTN